MHNNKIPKTIQRWIARNESILESTGPSAIWMEEDGFGCDHQGDWSIWCYLKPGLTLATDPGRHNIHEATVTEFMRETKNIIECTCSECEWTRIHQPQKHIKGGATTK